MSSDGFCNLLVNKLSDEIRQYYSGGLQDNVDPNLIPLYNEVFLMEFGEHYFNLPHVKQTLTGLAIATAACLHASYQPGEPAEAVLSRMALARLSAASQSAKLEMLFQNVEIDSDEE